MYTPLSKLALSRLSLSRRRKSKGFPEAYNQRAPLRDSYDDGTSKEKMLHPESDTGDRDGGESGQGDGDRRSALPLHCSPSGGSSDEGASPGLLEMRTLLPHATASPDGRDTEDPNARYQLPSVIRRSGNRSPGELSFEDPVPVGNGARGNVAGGRSPTAVTQKSGGSLSGWSRGRLRRTVMVTRWMAYALGYVSLLAAVSASAWYTHEMYVNGAKRELVAWFSAGAFVLLGFPISICGILGHLSHYYQPDVQCYVVRILWMVPFYSIQSWLCLRFRKYALQTETIRDTYESYVLYCFLYYLVAVLGGEEELVLVLKDKSPTRGHHMWPMHYCMKPWLMGQPTKRRGSTVHWNSPFLTNCKFGVLQYVLIRNATAWITLILDAYGLYDEGNFSLSSSYFYLVFIVNTSQCWALYVLALFYYATKNELTPINPVGKFLAVKALVFFTWWQSVAINMLYQMKFIPEGGDWTSEDVAKGIQDYLICIEMFLASIIHMVVFPHTEYTVNKRIKRSKAPSHKKVGRRNTGLRRYRKKYSNCGDESVASTDGSITIYDLDDERSVELIPQVAISEGVGLEGDEGSVQSKIEVVEEPAAKTSIMQALIQSSLPKDVVDGTIGIVKGDFIVDQQTLLRHAEKVDERSLFSMPKKEYVAKAPGAPPSRGLPGQRRRAARNRGGPDAAFVLNSGLTKKEGNSLE